MKSGIFSILKYYYIIIWCYTGIGVVGFTPVCDITDIITRQLSTQALTIWSLLDLAEEENIVNHQLFYDELCQATLKLCKEVQQLKESGYPLPESQLACFDGLFDLLHRRFKALPVNTEHEIRYIHAIDIILQYAYYFLKK